jgi:hypothetical protein
MKNSSNLPSFCFVAPEPMFLIRHFLPKFAATAHIAGSKRSQQLKTFSNGYKGQKTAELNSLRDACKGEHKIFGNVPKMLGNDSFHPSAFFYHLGPILHSTHKAIGAQ